MYKVHSASNLGFFYSVDNIDDSDSNPYSIDPRIYQGISNYMRLEINLLKYNPNHRPKPKILSCILSWLKRPFVHKPIYNSIVLKYTYTIIEKHIQLSLSAQTKDHVKIRIKSVPHLTSQKI